MSFYLGSRFQTDNTVHRKVVDVEVIVEASSLGRKFQTENVSNSFKKVMISYWLDMIVFCFTQLWDFEEQTLVWLIYFVHVQKYVFMSHPMWWYLKRIFIAWKPCRCAVMAPKKRGSPGPQGVGLAKIISEHVVVVLWWWWWWWWLWLWLNNITFSMVLSRGRELVEAPNRCPLGGKSPMQLGPEGRMYIIRRGWEMGKISPMPAETGPFQLLRS